MGNLLKIKYDNINDKVLSVKKIGLASLSKDRYGLEALESGGWTNMNESDDYLTIIAYDNNLTMFNPAMVKMVEDRLELYDKLMQFLT